MSFPPDTIRTVSIIAGQLMAGHLQVAAQTAGQLASRAEAADPEEYAALERGVDQLCASVQDYEAFANHAWKLFAAVMRTQPQEETT